MASERANERNEEKTREERANFLIKDQQKIKTTRKKFLPKGS
jgi:hypothetical protein